jgi:predicted NBD/HSP70 family sugar kinase
MPQTNGAVHHLQTMRTRLAEAEGVDLQFMSDLNRLRVLNWIRQYGPAPRFQIADALHLSRSTITKIVGQLLEDRLVSEGETIEASLRQGQRVGGRPATPIYFNADAGYAVGVDVGRSHLTLVLTNLAAEQIGEPTSLAFDVNAGPEMCVKQLARALTQFVVYARQRTWKHIVGIGISLPGPLDVVQHVLVDPPNMEGWDGVDIRQLVAREVPVPAERIHVDNDANLGALAESRLGAGQNIPNLVYLKLGTGIGAGLIINGDLFHGSSGSAGEIGHVCMDPKGRTCYCRRHRGCLETIAGAAAIARAARGDRANHAEVPIANVIQAARRGDPASSEAIRHAAETVGRALADLVNLLNPSRILIGGQVADAGEHLILEPIRQTVEAGCLSLAWRGLGEDGIQLATLGNRAVALGAVVAVLDATFRLPSTDGFKAVVTGLSGAPGATSAPGAV